MRLGTLTIATDLMLARWSSEVLDRGDHLLVRTPGEPDYWMGNTLVVPPPEAGDDAALWLARWQGAFERAFAGAAHRSLLVDGDLGPEVEAAVAAAGWVMQKSVALAATALPDGSPPGGVVVRVLDGAADWAKVTELALHSDEHAARVSGGEPLDDLYRGFVVARGKTKRAWCEAGRGAWWGAFAPGDAGDQLVGSLGVFAHDGLGRYQDVVTHPAWRRQGVARALLCAAGRDALARVAKRIVIVASVGSDASRLYRAVGFEPADVSSELLRKPR